MVASNRRVDEPTEASPLLVADAPKSIEASLDAINGTVASGGDGTVKHQTDGNDILRGESGEVEDAGNPLFEGLPEVAARLNLLVPAVGIGIFLAAADQTIIVSTYGKIGSELDALNRTSWIAMSYFLTLTTFQPLYGKLSDIFGRKEALLFAYAVFGIGCLFCGLARDMNELIGARAVAGIGGGGMTTVVSILLSDIVPLRERGTWQGYINVIFAIGASMGAPLGGLFADNIGWRWAFIAQAPMCLIAFAAVYLILDLPTASDTRWREKLSQVDFLGAFALVTATSTLLLGLDRGSNVSWFDHLTLLYLTVSLPLAIIFIFIEMRVASHPFAPGRIILAPALAAAYLCNFFSMASYMAAIFYIPLFFQAGDGVSATTAGLYLIPGIIGSVTGSVFGGLIMQKTGKYYRLTILAYAVSILAGNIPIFLFSGAVRNWTPGIIVGHILWGFGGGIAITTTLIALIANADAADQAVATACSYLFRSLGSVVGLSMSSTVVQQLLRMQLHRVLGDGDEVDTIVEKVRQSLAYIMELDPPTRELVRHCYQKAINATFGLTTGLAVLALLGSFWIRESKLSK